jgi:general stress protein YciG
LQISDQGNALQNGVILSITSTKSSNLNFYCMEHDQENLDNMRRQLNTSTRGFASMDPERQRQIAREGGKAAHVKGTAHEFNSEEARNAGRKGGEMVSRDRDHMAEIGRKGGRSSGNNRKPDDETRNSF